MSRFITLRPDLWELLRQEASLHDRTIRSQALHWLLIGKAVEASGLYTHAELTALFERFDAETRPEEPT